MEGLKDESDASRPAGRAAILVERREIGARESDPAGSGRVEPRQQRQERGFSGAGSADDGN